MTQVFVRGSLLSNGVKLRALVANGCEVSQISQRLAKQLGMTDFHSIYISDLGGNCCLRWIISKFSVVISGATDLWNKSILSLCFQSST